MGKELKKMYKTALVSMNYFFLQIIFRDRNNQNNNQKEVKCELILFLDTLAKENLSEEVSILFKEELIIGEYLSNKSLKEIEFLFEKGIIDIFEEEYPELLDFYMNLVESIIKNKPATL